MESSGSRYGNRCVICGKPARVNVGASAYCLDCYNRIADYLVGVDSPTNDSYDILALDPAGHTVEFEVERFSFGNTSVWTAVEHVPEDDPRKTRGYVGRSISIAADARLMSQEEAFDALMVKVQRLVGHTSLRSVPVESGQSSKASVLREGRMLCANETGVAHIEPDEYGTNSVVIDGQRFTPEQFVELLSCFEGHDLYWQVRDASDEPPAWL